MKYIEFFIQWILIGDHVPMNYVYQLYVYVFNSEVYLISGGKLWLQVLAMTAPVSTFKIKGYESDLRCYALQ